MVMIVKFGVALVLVVIAMLWNVLRLEKDAKRRSGQATLLRQAPPRIR